jgi:putative membrane protein
MKVSESESLDVDARFLLANERTLLAWIRTSIAVEAGGIALIQVHKHHSYLGVSVLLFGGFVALIGYQRYRSANQAIRSNKLPPEGIGPALQVICVVLTALVLAAAEYTFLK